MKTILSAAVLVLAAAGPGLALDVPLTVAEPIGVARTDERIIAGVPLARGQFRDAAGLSLWEGDVEVPCQFTVLSRRPNGSAWWVLADLQASVPADGLDRFAGFDANFKYDYGNCTVGHVAMTPWAWSREEPAGRSAGRQTED